MLKFFRSSEVQILTFCLLLGFIALVVSRPFLTRTIYPNLTSDQIGHLVPEGTPKEKVEKALGPPDSREDSTNTWHYTNAQKSVMKETSIIPAIIAVGFDDSEKVEIVIMGPSP